MVQNVRDKLGDTLVSSNGSVRLIDHFVRVVGVDDAAAFELEVEVSVLHGFGDIDDYVALD